MHSFILGHMPIYTLVCVCIANTYPQAHTYVHMCTYILRYISGDTHEPSISIPRHAHIHTGTHMCVLCPHIYTILNDHMCSHRQIPTGTTPTSSLLYYKRSISQPSTSHNPGLPASSAPLRLWIHCEHDLPAHPEADFGLQPISEGAEEATGFWKAGYPQGTAGCYDASCHVPGEPTNPY